MTDIVFDAEFLDDGKTIDLISIGMINRSTGAELYLVNADADWDRIANRRWLAENVVIHLPLVGEITKFPHHECWKFEIDRQDRRVLPKAAIAEQVAAFVLAAPRPRLCAWYASYDMVALNQLWGAMVDKPAGIPWWCWDFKQACAKFGIEDDHLPAQSEGLHDALADARTLLARIEWAEGQVSDL